jgi:hypothetical protein
MKFGDEHFRKLKYIKSDNLHDTLKYNFDVDVMRTDTC